MLLLLPSGPWLGSDRQVAWHRSLLSCLVLYQSLSSCCRHLPLALLAYSNQPSTPCNKPRNEPTPLLHNPEPYTPQRS